MTNFIQQAPLKSHCSIPQNLSLTATNLIFHIHISPTPSALILRQIFNDKIGFDFLTNSELMSFLIAVLSTIDRSYQSTDLSESFRLFSELIIAQSVHILRSCSNHQEDISISQSCLIAST